MEMDKSNPEYYLTSNIRKLASNAKIKYYTKYSKRQLCILLGVEFKIKQPDGYPHVLTNVQTGEIKVFNSANSLGSNLNIHWDTVLKKARSGKPLVVNGVSYMVKKLY